MFVRQEKQQILQEYTDDIEKYFAVTIDVNPMIEEGGLWLEVVGPKVDEALEFLEVLTGDFTPVQTDDIPFPATLKPVLREALSGYFAMVIQFQYKVLLIGLDKNDESLTVQGKDDNRLNSTGCLLLLQELMEKPGYHQLDTEGIGNKFKQLIREVEEPIYTRAMIEPLNIGLKQKLWALITDADYPCINKEKIRSKNLEKKTIIVKKKSITDIESAKRRREPSFTEMQPSSSRQSARTEELEKTGEKILQHIQTSLSTWDIVKAQIAIFEIIEECKNSGNKMETSEWLARIKSQMEDPTAIPHDDDIVLIEDDPPPDAVQVDEEIVHEWFIQSYEESPAYNMSIYKNELFKQFLAHFELRYSGENMEQTYNIFITQIHSCLQKYKVRYSKVLTKGNTGKNAKKRFIHLRRKGSDTPEIPNRASSPSPASPSPWTDLASVVNPRIAPIMLEESVRNIQKKKNNSNLLDRYLLKVPWIDRFKPGYEQYGAEGDDSTRTIVIDGSNVARCHGKVGEIKRKHGDEIFSILGIKIAVEQFWQMGCRRVTVFLPQNRQGNKGTPRIPEAERKLQREMEEHDIIKYTPGRFINGKYIQSYDDRFILQMASDEEGIVVSNDQFRDLIVESKEFKSTINNRLLPLVH